MYKSEIKQFLEERKIEYLIHFTRTTNLKSILKYGLLPVSWFEDTLASSIGFNVTDLDGRGDVLVL